MKETIMKRILTLLLLMPFVLNSMELSSLDEGVAEMPAEISVTVYLNSSNSDRYSYSNNFFVQNNMGHFSIPSVSYGTNHPSLDVPHAQAAIHILNVNQSEAIVQYVLTCTRPTTSWTSYFLSWFMHNNFPDSIPLPRKHENLVQVITNTIILPIGEEHASYIGHTPHDNMPDRNYVAALIIKASQTLR